MIGVPEGGISLLQETELLGAFRFQIGDLGFLENIWFANNGSTNNPIVLQFGTHIRIKFAKLETEWIHEYV